MAGERLSRNEIIAILAEIFREHGYAGTSLSVITNHTGLGKGSLYHFFPEGKPDMAKAVLHNIDSWFEDNIFSNIREGESAIKGIDAMFSSVQRYFDSGNRICLVGAFALDNTRDHFAHEINSYFTEWTDALAFALKRTGMYSGEAIKLAEDVVAGIQGALVLARSKRDSRVFTRVLRRLKKRVMGALSQK